VVTEQVNFGALQFPFSRIVNPDRVLDEVAAEADLRDRLAGKHAPDDQLHLPYWAELWDSARGMGTYLISAECRVKSEKSRNLAGSKSASLFTLHSSFFTYDVLDLGCGMGMAGTVAAALGARVLFADLETPALLFAQLNSLPWRRRVQTRRLDWTRDRLTRRFDLILGADILYERAQWAFLDAFWRAHLKEGGQVMLGEPGRQTGDLFIEWITSRGWRLITQIVPVSTRPRPIRIFIIS
jgi:predicted nicotinamide N-methyase